MLYSPSYVSGDYALAYYGIIPETVQTITSMTTGSAREFATPIGNFAYFQHHTTDFFLGVENIRDGQNGQNNFLIAGIEKAIYDKVLIDRRFDGTDIENRH